MSPGNDVFFRLFLSSRWGVPLASIDALPASEFIQHKAFWEKYRWGLQDDLLAICASQITSHRTGSKPTANVYSWKELALSKSGQLLKRVGLTPLTEMRANFMMIAKIIGRRQD